MTTFERHFVAYGVRIGFRADCRALLDALEQDPNAHLPFGWRAIEGHESDAPCRCGTSFVPADRVVRRRHIACMPERTLSRTCAD